MKMLVMFLLVFVPVALFGQVQDSTAYPIPGTIFNIFADLNYWLSSTATVAGVTIFLTLIVSRAWTTITAIWKQIVALVIALILTIIGNIVNIGFMADFNVISTIVYGIVIGFMANGLYDLKNIQK